MFLLGICSIFQMIFLPGFIALKPFKINGIIRVTIFSFALSLIINYCMVFLLTSTGLYTRAIVFLIFGIEMLVFIKFIYPLLNQPLFTLTVSSTMFRSSLHNYQTQPFFNKSCIIMHFQIQGDIEVE